MVQSKEIRIEIAKALQMYKAGLLWNINSISRCSENAWIDCLS